MVTAKFDRAFRALVGAFKRYHDVRRSPDNIRELGQARITLDSARNDIRRARATLESTPPTWPVLKADVSDDSLQRLRLQAISSAARSG